MVDLYLCEPRSCRFKESCLRYRYNPPDRASRQKDFSNTIRVVSYYELNVEVCEYHIPLGAQDPLTLKRHGAIVDRPLEMA
jgi:hypothetical protein